jgi:hypothetical protein
VGDTGQDSSLPEIVAFIRVKSPQGFRTYVLNKQTLSILVFMRLSLVLGTVEPSNRALK